MSWFCTSFCKYCSTYLPKIKSKTEVLCPNGNIFVPNRRIVHLSLDFERRDEYHIDEQLNKCLIIKTDHF